MKLYNTLSKKIETIKRLNEKKALGELLKSFV